MSALVLAPIAVVAAWFGSPWLPLVTAVAAAVMAWEWARLCRQGRVGLSGWFLVGIVIAAVIAAALRALGPAIAITLAGAAAVYSLARGGHDREPSWIALGTLWIAVPSMLLLWLAQRDGIGGTTVLWVFAVVWATDIGAYGAGRTLGGPRLAPRWSPRKTWAGLIGGAGCAAIAGWTTAHLLETSSALLLVLVSAALAIVGQFGDLAESVAKRRFGVKDSSGLIPGHGGLLDRLDGLLAVVPAVSLLTLIGGGSVLTWR